MTLHFSHSEADLHRHNTNEPEVKLINQEFTRCTEDEVRHRVAENKGQVIAFAAPDGEHIMLLQNDTTPHDGYGEDRIIFSRDAALELANNIATWAERTQTDWNEFQEREAKDKKALDKCHELVRKCHATMAAQLTELLPAIFEAVHKSVEDELAAGAPDAVLLGMVYDHWQGSTRKFLSNALPQDVSPQALAHHLFNCMPRPHHEEKAA